MGKQKEYRINFKRARLLLKTKKVIELLFYIFVIVFFFIMLGAEFNLPMLASGSFGVVVSLVVMLSSIRGVNILLKFGFTVAVIFGIIFTWMYTFVFGTVFAIAVFLISILPNWYRHCRQFLQTKIKIFKVS